MERFAVCLCVVALSQSCLAGYGWNTGPDEKVLLKDVQVLTLYHGRQTTGRRSSPVPQLQCVGGSAAHEFIPQVVQCYNKGWDGVDVQWECKTEMDDIYRFGRVEVVCEGFDYAEDPYVLKGSCGMEYTLDRTGKGYQKEPTYGGGSQYNQYGQHYGQNTDYSQKSGGFGNIIILLAAVGVMYALYRTCVAPALMTDRSSTSDDYPDNQMGGGSGGAGWRNPSAPPPPGFRDTYSAGDSCGSQGNRRASGGTGGGGFWTGMFTGGMLGYMFGGNSNTGYGTGYGTRTRYATPHTGYSQPSYSGSSFSSGSSSRTTSGFGGTRRR